MTLEELKEDIRSGEVGPNILCRMVDSVVAELLAACETAAKIIRESVRLEQTSFDSPPEPATKWDDEADRFASELDALIARVKGTK